MTAIGVGSVPTLQLQPVWSWWEVDLRDMLDITHTYRVYAHNRTAAIVKAYNDAEAEKYHDANSWELSFVERSY